MRKLIIIAGILALLWFTQCAREITGDYYIKPVDFTRVEVEDAFWSPRLEINRKITIPYAFQKCEETHRIANFAVAGGLQEGTFEGIYFNDSDVYKVIEGAAYALHLYPDPELEAYVDGVIASIAAAQEDDGYLYTSRTILNPDNMPPGGVERWSHIQHGHELYNVGHMYEAAVAYYHATGKRTLLDVAIRNAELILSVFGPDGMRYPPGHQEIEIGLARLYRETGDDRYLNLAKFFLDERGDSTGHPLYGEYAQDHMPVVKQTRAVGHAVRAAYMYTGMADIAALTGNKAYITAIKRIWSDVVGNKLYITGGIGASGGNEGFGKDYHLPNATAYCETCASIANAMWNHRLFLMTGQAKYMDIVERVIYNSFLSGISMEGDHFFYPNRLESATGAKRAAWFGCACCPSNIVRFMPSIPGYIYGARDSDIYINLFIAGAGNVLLNDQTVNIVQKNNYPWTGDLAFHIMPEKPSEFTINVRIPGWAQSRPVPGDLYTYMSEATPKIGITVNGKSVPFRLKNGFVRVKREWKAGDIIKLNIPMPVRRIIPHENIEEDRGKISLERGPVVFAAEGIDQEDGEVRHLIIPDWSQPHSAFQPDLLGGVQTIETDAFAISRDEAGTLQEKQILMKLIPYYAWAHRGLTPMTVWINRQ